MEGFVRRRLPEIALRPATRIEHETALGRWSLIRAEPAPSLVGVVQEYWEVKGALSPFREALLPNGSVEVMINLGPSHRVLSGRGAGKWERAWFSGLQERAIFIESMRGTHLVSARLHPLGAATLLGPRVADAASSIVDLGQVIGDDSAISLHAAVARAGDATARFAVLEHFLMTRTPPQDGMAEIVRQAATRIEHARGHLRIATLHRSIGVSRKHLSVSFTRCLGISPKRYANIRRFLWTMDRLRESVDVNWPTLATEAGYSDQSHLARDFRRIGAASPTEYLRRLDPDATALLELATGADSS